MNTFTSTPDITNALELLAQAGLTAVAVESCDDRDCHWCDPAPLPAAA
ncbi:MAG: hypothetical protein HKN74_14930 [Acidimicrobiia bacterium]|nr:hypothetical protein [Acidimicrobiia bacterium]MBT8216074.1 hypothetical protein [Acidimicrobiia bacterium]NNF11568.1 hypothetical protein [Acidimicrobiia bacterium]NNL70449.1 hypothetical protein [Acidimicrobiia bacterium]